MRYAVTGATGFLGRALTARLLAAGHEVSALVRDPSSAQDLAEAGVSLHQGDILDRASVRAAVAGADGVFHLAAWYRVGVRSGRAEQVNVDGTATVLRTAWETGAAKIVHTSTVAVFSDTAGRKFDETYRHDGPFLSEYERTKWMAHYDVAEPMAAEGAPVVIVQPGVIYGPGDHSPTGRLIRSYLERRLRYLPAGNAACWGHVDDTVDAHVAAMERGRGGESYIVAGPPHTFVEAFEIARDVTGIPLPRLRIPPGPTRALSRVLTPASRLLPALAGQAELARLAGVTYLADNTKARTELGFTPRSLEAGFAEVLPRLLDELG